MIIINERVEEKLLQTLKTLKTSGWQPRCIYIDGQNGTLNRLVDIPLLANNHINGEQTQYFSCEDGDIFILGPEITAKSSAALRDEIVKEAGHALSSEKNFFSLFDVRAQWFSLMSIIEHKLEREKEKIRRQTEETDRLKREHSRQRVLSLDFDKALVKSIAQRRSNREKRTTLIVEDDMFTRMLVTSTLKGLSFVPAGSGEEAIRNYVTTAPDIVFLDIGLPDVSGHDVLKKLLELDPQAFVVMLSGGGSRDNIMQSMAAGAKGFIVKPFTQEKIMQYIEKCPAPAGVTP